MTKYVSIFIFVAVVVQSCGRAESKKTDSSAATPEVALNADPRIAKLETAHHKGTFESKPGVSFDISLFFGGKERFNAAMTLADNSGSMIELADGERIYVNGNDVFVSPELGAEKNARFDAFTWSYFFLLPYKLSDPGTQWSSFAEEMIGDVAFNRQKLSFGAGTGDAPDDWYDVFSDANTHLIQHAAYIVTAGKKTQAEAEEDPHAIQYLDYRLVGGVPISHEWKFFGWTLKDGLTDELGYARLSNVKFLNDVSAVRAIPDRYIKQ